MIIITHNICGRISITIIMPGIWSNSVSKMGRKLPDEFITCKIYIFGDASIVCTYLAVKLCHCGKNNHQNTIKENAYRI